MLQAIRLDDWKSFGPERGGRTEVPLGPLTFLLGPNASGKSNVLDALRFLQGVGLDLPLVDVLRGRWEGQRMDWPPIRGHVAEAARYGTEHFGITTEWLLSDKGSLCSEGQPRTKHHIEVDTQSDVLLASESLYEDDVAQFDTRAASLQGRSGRMVGGAINVALRGTGQGNSPSQSHSSTRSLLSQLVFGGRVHKHVGACVQALRQALRQATFLDIRPSAMREYRPEGQQVLGVTGENLSPLLHSLSTREPSVFEDVTDWLSELLPEFERFDFDRTELREVMVFVVERGGHRVSARSLSDGTLRFLGEVLAVLTAPAGSLMVIEEPDAGLHPARVRALAELLQHSALKRGTQVLATTHSAALLSQLSEETLSHAVAFGRDQATGTTICQRLGLLPYFETLKDAARLEHLVSTGWLERAL